MSSLEQLIKEARLLGTRLREGDSFVDALISQADNMQQRLVAMKEYEEDLQKINDVPKRKPRHKLIMEIAQESKQIRDLKTENLELKACLDEHQSALELIMTKYREQMRQFMMTKKLEDNILKVLEANNCSEGLMREKICEMVSVMRHAAMADDASADQESERITQLMTENRGLKELLKINRKHGVNLTDDRVFVDESIQTESSEETLDDDDGNETAGEESDSEDDNTAEMDSSINSAAQGHSPKTDSSNSAL